ncbi:MAG: acetoacetate--CoA ligase, partial [Chloroflexi bacterium]|nr:acetoacetate--CoA ligase [Chloroflexota bacterium]
MSNMTEGAILWQPSAELREQASLTRYMRWLEARHGTSFADYAALWQWSVADIERFWASIWDFFEIASSTPYTQVLSQHEMPGARWFTGAQINFAEHVFRNATSERPAMIFQSELTPLTEISWQELQQQVAAI